jgi:hypothetical protein
MKALALLSGFLAACSGSQPRPPTTGERGITTNAQLADLDVVLPSYSKPELQKALIAARGVEATREHAVAELEAGDPDQLRVAIADLAVQRRFIASLEACEATQRWCPPRLDDPPWSYDIADDNAKPPLDTPLRFDADSWRKVTAELFGRACACRTIACVESLGIAIDRMETRVMQDVRDDDAAAAAVTHARECLFRLRGRSIARTPAPL